MVTNNNSDIERAIISSEGQREAAVQLAKATRQLNASFSQAARELSGRLAGALNPLRRFEDSLTRLDQSNRAALRIGTTTAKLQESVNKNSDILQRNNVSNQKLLDAMTQNFESGVRVQNGAIMDLTEEMIATGQDLTGLRSMNSDLLLFTGDNIKALQDTNRANREISDKYGVSNQKLIESVNSLRSTFEAASFFGADTTASLQSLSQELKARTGGKNVEGAIQTLFGLGTGGLGNLSAALRTGAGGLRARISSGQAVGMSDIQPILSEVARIASESGGGNLGLGADIAAMRTGLSRDQVIQLVNLNNQLTRNYELSADQKKTSDDTLNSLQNINERAKNFYDGTAIKSLDALGSIDTNLIAVGVGLTQAIGAVASMVPLGPGGIRGNVSKMSAQFGRVAARGVLGAAGAAAGMGIGSSLQPEEGPQTGMGILGRVAQGAGIGSFGGIGGAIIGAGGGLLYGIYEMVTGTEEHTKKTAEATAKSAEVAEAKQREERAQAAARELQRIQFLAGYIRSRTDLTFGRELIPYLERMVKQGELAANAASQSNLGSRKTK